MHKLPDQLLQWLYRVLQPEYSNPVLTYQDTSLILLCYSFFKVRTAVYTNESGTSKLLVKIYGDLNLHSNGITVSIDLWIPSEYPQNPPIIYVRSALTSDVLSPSNYIDHSGKFYHPFLSSWTGNYGADTSNDGIRPNDNRLLRLVGILIQCFENHPPRKLEGGQDESGNSPASGSPASGSPGPRGPQGPPIPPAPTVPTVPTKSTPRIPPVPPRPSPHPDTAIDQSLLPRLSRLRLLEEETTNVQSSPPPLLPANPSNLQLVDSIRKTLNESVKYELFDELPLTELVQTQNRLLQSTEAEFNTTSYLDYFERKIDENRRLLVSKQNQLDRLDSELDRDLNEVLPKFDECLIAETPVFNQLYRLVTTVEAITDLMYHLDKLHDKGKIKFDRYLKVIRQLAREQCLLKQHVAKLVEVCGLEPSG
ncbi:DEKNAAC103106 [Brettanomyces naardenensis]|uniref:DEKNAAC103106 n=1 Tax=Brettanomyces naardenensis TaxID=13370 RepID=A0A448YMG0_BRENA|nr:DEKNAAC103106 [Brettanomyces naardenensis]